LLPLIAQLRYRIGFDAEPRLDAADDGDGANGDGPTGTPRGDAADCAGYQPLAGLTGTYRIVTAARTWLAAE
jgi:hypothetical protein